MRVLTNVELTWISGGFDSIEPITVEPEPGDDGGWDFPDPYDDGGDAGGDWPPEPTNDGDTPDPWDGGDDGGGAIDTP